MTYPWQDINFYSSTSECQLVSKCTGGGLILTIRELTGWDFVLRNDFTCTTIKRKAVIKCASTSNIRAFVEFMVPRRILCLDLCSWWLMLLTKDTTGDLRNRCQSVGSLLHWTCLNLLLHFWLLSLLANRLSWLGPLNLLPRLGFLSISISCLPLG